METLLLIGPKQKGAPNAQCAQTVGIKRARAPRHFLWVVPLPSVMPLDGKQKMLSSYRRMISRSKDFRQVGFGFSPPVLLFPLQKEYLSKKEHIFASGIAIHSFL